MKNFPLPTCAASVLPGNLFRVPWMPHLWLRAVRWRSPAPGVVEILYQSPDLAAGLRYVTCAPEARVEVMFKS